MKIGLLTQFNYLNYGNRLQNFATQEVLKGFGHEVESLVFSPSRFIMGVYPFFKAFGWLPFFNKVSKRINSFKKFTKDYLPNTQEIDKFNLKTLEKMFGTNGETPLDLAVIGSDQVWNPSYVVNFNKVFAGFVEKEKRVSYATSFGVSEIPKKYYKKYVKGLNEMSFISTRETAGAELVKAFTGRSCPTLVDPTLMIGKKDWENYTKDIDIAPKEKYIFCYFLTGKRAYRKWVKNYAKENGLKIVSVNDIRTKYFYANPLDFIKLILNAELVCTDSFHVHALSIKLEKPFVSFHTKKSTTSRITTILKLTGLEDRNYLYLPNSKILNIDYSAVTPIIDNAVNIAKEYLNVALNCDKGAKNAISC